MKLLLNRKPQSGATLLVTLMLLIVVTLLGLSTIRTATMEERMSRYAREQAIAFQAGEAALVDAEFDLDSSTSTRATLIHDSAFRAGCLNGLCMPSAAGVPVWRQAATLGAVYGTYGRRAGGIALPAMPVGAGANSVSQNPRYVAELFYRTGPGESVAVGVGGAGFKVYRITAVGFGPSVQTQSWLQTTYRPL